MTTKSMETCQICGELICIIAHSSSYRHSILGPHFDPFTHNRTKIEPFRMKVSTIELLLQTIVVPIFFLCREIHGNVNSAPPLPVWK